MSQTLIKILQWFSITFIIKLKPASDYHTRSVGTLGRHSLPHSHLFIQLQQLYFLPVLEYKHVIVPGFTQFLSSPPQTTPLDSMLCSERLCRPPIIVQVSQNQERIVHHLNGRNLMQGTSDSCKERTEKPVRR